MTRKTLIFLVIFIFGFLFSNGYAQQDEYDPTGSIRSTLGAQVHSMFGSDYDVGFYVMDSLIGKTLHPQDEEITDPYGTLNGCILFRAFKVDPLPEVLADYDSLISGVFKNGQIVWHTDPMKWGSISQLIGTLDLNHDGEVDILSLCDDPRYFAGRESGPEFLWIFSWNGITGRIINDVDSTGQSKIVSDGSLEFFETQGDSTKKFIGRITQDYQDEFPFIQTTTLPCVTYGWNGVLYGFWSTVPQATETVYLPANLMTVSVHSSGSFDGTFYHYYYTWTNSYASRQQLSEIWLAHLDPTGSVSSPLNWESYDSSLIGRRSWFLFKKFKSNMIKPGQTISGFSFLSNSIPAIIEYYIQGDRPDPRILCGTNLLSIEDERNDILTNSVSGYTLGPRNPPLPLDKINFLDTLKSYTTQSRSLGWITSQSTANGYATLLDSVKAQFQRNDNRSARSTLDTVMQHAVQDSSRVLSSEAFALIYFNTQYLLKQLPAIEKK